MLCEEWGLLREQPPTSQDWAPCWWQEVLSLKAGPLLGHHPASKGTY